MPVWGVLIILSLCTLCLWITGYKFFDLAVRDRKGPLLALPVLAALMLGAIWLGYLAVSFNARNS